MTALLFVIIAICNGMSLRVPKDARAQPSPAGAEAYFIDLKDGATVPAQLQVYFGCAIWASRRPVRTCQIQGIIICWSILSRRPSIEPIPNDFNHLHFGAGQTETEIDSQTRRARPATAHGR